MAIPDHKIEEVRAASDIVDVVGDYVRLRKRGTNYFGLCPFHHEKTPSFSVNPAIGIFKCFGCAAGGNVFQFVMRVESLGFIEAVRHLAERANISLPIDQADQEKAGEVDSIYHALRFAARFYYEALTQTDEGKPGLDYLLGRGIAPESIKKFGLGYAPNQWDALQREAEKKHVDPSFLEKAGLVLPRKEGGGYYDRFRGRILFPIFSHVGKVVGFGGRIMQDEPGQPKYINSPETLVYSKSRILYGLYQARQAIRKQEEAILVEGYTDVIALHQAGIANVVASSGTALTHDQVKLLGRYAKRVIVLYDADTAGVDAALRGIDIILEQGLSAYAVMLPAGEDPDSFVRNQGGQAFFDYVKKHRQDFVVFTQTLARRSGKLDTPEGQAEVMHDILASIARIQDPLRRETFLRRASEVLRMPDIQLRPILADQMKHDQGAPRRSAPAVNEVQDGRSEQVASQTEDAQALPDAALQEPLPQEKILLRLMLEHRQPLVEFILNHMALEEFTAGPSRDIVQALVDMYHEGQIDPQRFFDGSLSAAIQSLAAEVLVDRYEPSENWTKKQIRVVREDPEIDATSAMTLLKQEHVNRSIQGVKKKIYLAEQQGTDVTALQQEFKRLIELMKFIQNKGFLQQDASLEDQGDQ